MQLSAIYTLLIVLLLLVLLSCKSIANGGGLNCSMHQNDNFTLGGVVDRTTRVGKEQEIAMKIAVKELNLSSSCVKLALYLRGSSQCSDNDAISTALKLTQDKKVQALVIGTLPIHEFLVLSYIHKYIPLLLTLPTATPPSLLSTRPSNLIEFSNNLSIHMQCLAAIISFFQWRRVTVIYEQSYLSSSIDLATVTVTATVEQYIGLISSSVSFEQELRKLKNGSNRVFVVVQCSVELAIRLFQQASQMGMLEKGFVWIVSDEVASLLDSFDSSVIASMQGVIGYKTYFKENTKSYKEFKIKFEKSYLGKYPAQGNPCPSLFALRAYDAVKAISMATIYVTGTKHDNHTNRTYHPTSVLTNNLMLSNFEGLSGNVSFKNGKLQSTPTFQIINVVGKSYRELAFWTPGLGFSKDHPSLIEPQSHDRAIELGPIYWPGGQQEVPRGWTLGATEDKPLRIGVPANGAFHQFVNVTIDEAKNRTFITGFAVDVFKASLRHLHYDLPFVLVPFYGEYGELVHEIHKKGYDGAVGDISILEERYKWADFTQPYVKSGMQMVVTVEEEKIKEMWMFLMVFEWQMWVLIPSTGLFIGYVVWSIEHKINPEFGSGSVFQQIGIILWFSFSVLFFAQKESPRRNLSKLVLAPWYFLVAMLFIYFQAALTSQMTISQLLPSVKDVETLRRENAYVGCNWNSFICTYLVDVLHFKPENIRHMKSIDDYPIAFQRGDIKAAFFVSSHAQVFLAKYCIGYTTAGHTYTFGGLGFAFGKGSPLSIDMSIAMLKATENGEIMKLENEMLANYNKNCSTSTSPTSVGPEPFSGLFFISGCISFLALLFSIFSSFSLSLSFSSSISILQGCTYLSTTFWVLSSKIIFIFSRTQNSTPTLRQDSNSSITLNEIHSS